MRHRATSRLLAGLTVVAVTAVGTGRPAAADPAAGAPPAAAAQITTAQLSAATAGRVTTAVAPAVVASQSKTGLAVMSPWSLRPAVEPNLTDAQRVAFEDQMIKDLVEAKVKTVRLEIAAPGETAVDFTLYRRLIDKLPSDVKVIAVLNFALVEGGVSNSGVPASEPYLYQLQDSVAVSQYPEYGTTTKFMKVWIDKALSVVTTFGSRLAAVEVLNEANKLYHPGTAAHPGPYVVPGDAYGRLIGKFYRYCRLAGSKPCGSTVKVITHGMHPGMDGGDSGTANDDTNHLSGVLSSASVAAFRAANGGAWPFDGIGYHPYPFAMGLSLPGGYANTATSTLLAGINGRLDAVRAVLTAAGVPQSTSLFWLTEVGFNSNDVSASTLEEKEAKQGQYVKDVFTALANRADTAQAIWYRYHQGNADAPAENWGLVAHTDRVYSKLPPRYKRAYCDFVWERGVGATEHCPRPKEVVWRTHFNNVLYPVSYWEMPQYVVDAGASYPSWQLQQDVGGQVKQLSGYCSPIDPYGCSTSDYSRFPVPSARDASARFRVRFTGLGGTGPWSDWLSYAPLIGSGAGVYGPASGATLNFKTQYVSFPVAVPTQWLRDNPGGQPFMRFHQNTANGGWVRLWSRPSMPSTPANFQESSDHVLYVFNLSVTADSSRSFTAGPVQFLFGIAPAACATDVAQCLPTNTAETITYSFNHS
ncbi:hypothetical protein [Micromonospora haikouensis]|uniref:hypothetical protein n=1 Tax=Micromonospora haikouensis TaxID=686309 RepID=UPI003D74D420